MSKLVRFAERLPTQQDADSRGHIYLVESNGNRRVGMWDWIRPTNPDAVDLWHCNGFVAWQRLTDTILAAMEKEKPHD